jgi:hypothetical protein
MKKTVSIFIRAFNDLDQILPIINHISSKPDIKKINIYTLNKQISGSDYLLKFLKNDKDIEPIFFDKIICTGFTSIFCYFQEKTYLLKRQIIFKPKLFLLMFLIKYIQIIFEYILSKKIKKYINLLPSNNVILIDFGVDNIYPYSYIIKYARKQLIPVVQYLHGYDIYTNIDITKKEKISLSMPKRVINAIQKRKHKRGYSDVYLVGNEQKNTWFKSTAMENFEKYNRVMEIGIPRFTSEWINYYRNTVNKCNKFNYGDPEKLNVILFLSHPQYNVDIDLLISTINVLSNKKNINFAYKPHTRKGMDGLDVNKIKGKNAHNISSLNLSEWADVGIVFGSSIGFQLLSDGVPLIIPRYIDSNNTIFEKYHVCLLADSVEELSTILDKKDIRKNYDANYFLKKIVYGGKTYEDMLDSFYWNIIKCKSNSNTKRRVRSN